jgi:hypothetical protein
MKLTDLKGDVQKYKNTQIEINRKRKLWHTETKALITESLKKITQMYALDWEVVVVETTRNLEGINLTLGNNFSSIYSENELGKKSYAKTGGNLIFSQAYNGDVFIVFMTPTFDQSELLEDSQNIIGKINPSKIDEEFIIQRVSHFLIELSDWESLKSSHAIGFKVG